MAEFITVNNETISREQLDADFEKYLWIEVDSIIRRALRKSGTPMWRFVKLLSNTVPYFSECLIETRKEWEKWYLKSKVG